MKHLKSNSDIKILGLVRFEGTSYMAGMKVGIFVMRRTGRNFEIQLFSRPIDFSFKLGFSLILIVH